MTVLPDLTNAVAERCIERLKEAGYSFEPTNDEDAIYTYFSVMHRRVKSQPRTVHKADYFVPAHLVAGEQQLLEKVAAGGNLWPHQSRKIGNLSVQDAMLNDFGVQHFHLGTTLKAATNLIEGTKELLFAGVGDQDFYAIGIYDHCNWANEAVLDVVNKTWPCLMKPYELNSGPEMQLIGLFPDRTIEDTAKLRAAGFNVPVRLADGTILIMPGGGIACDNSSVAVRRETDQLIIDLKKLQREFASQFAQDRKSGVIPADRPVRIVWRDDPPSTPSLSPSIEFDISEHVGIPRL